MKEIAIKTIRKPAEQWIAHDTYKWVAQAETFSEASKYFKENAPNKVGHTHSRESQLLEEDMKSLKTKRAKMILLMNASFAERL